MDNKYALSISDYITKLLAQLDRQVAYSTMHGLAPSSTKNFKTHINTYVRFCQLYRLPMFPADTFQMRRYLQYLAGFHESVDSSKAYISGVRSLHMLLDVEAPDISHYLYGLTAQGIRRLKGHMVKQAAPFTPDIIAGIYHLVDFSQPKQVASYIAILLGFLTLFRKSNLVADSDVKFDPHHTLARRNFIRLKDSYLCRAYWSKTNQFHDRCLDIPLLPNPDPRLCPVRLLDWYFTIAPAGPLDPAFLYYRNGKRQALTYAMLSEWLKEWISQLGFDPDQFSLSQLAQGWGTMGLSLRATSPCGTNVG